MHISNKGIELIKAFESLQLHAYRCPAGLWTIGYGHTNNVQAHDNISADQAEHLLRTDLARVEQAINRMVTVPLTQGQYDALASFIFNCGIQAFSRSTLLTKLNKSNYAEAAEQFARWIYVQGKRSNGLVRRRKQEQQLFCT